MNKIRTIFTYEFLTILRSRSFLLTLILIPLVGLITILVVSGLQKNNQTSPLLSLITPSQEVTVVGLVDRSGVVTQISDEISPFVEKYNDAAAATVAVEAGQISGYFIISDDFLSNGEIEYFGRDFNPMGGDNNSYLIELLIQNNLLADDPILLKRFQEPIILDTTYLSTTPQRDPNSQLTFFLPYGITMLFYILILSSSSTMLSSITNEKQNRVMELLLTSMSPTQMLTGKILALGSIGLLQTVFWSLSGYLLMKLSGNAFSLPIEFDIPLSVFLWGITFFLLGYAMYASLMAGLGAMVPNLREGSQATFMVIFPLIIPMFFINTLIGQPNGTLSMVLSLFPLTSPVAMMTRLGAVQLPLWQPLLAAALQVLTAFLIVRAVAGMFRAQNLLAGQPFKFKVFLQALIGKA